MKRSEILVAAIGVAAGLAAVFIYAWIAATGPRALLRLDPASGWTEQRWPLRVDPWWPSKAFSCAKRQCGSAVTLYVRVKIGFCNCKTGVADDPELERISDFPLLAIASRPTAAGRPITIAWMKGRVRPYAMTTASEPVRSMQALAYGLNDRCDAVVATALFAPGSPPPETDVETAVSAFLASPPLLDWMRLSLAR